MKRLFTSRVLFAVVMLAASLSANAYVKLTALAGSRWDDSSESVKALVDRNDGTKWGQGWNAADTWVILKADSPIVPSEYFLITGTDNAQWNNRNWTEWKIYGIADVEDEAAVTRDSKAWVLIDHKEDQKLPDLNSFAVDFTVSEAQTTAYKYFMIEVLDYANGGYVQMTEFGFGTSKDFYEYLSTNFDDPLTYTIIAGDRNNGDGEGLPKLFDNNYGTKWGNGLDERNEGEHEKGAHFIIKTSRAIAPSYYKLVTGTDNESWNNRNWKQWQIYGIAEADFEGDAPDRWNDKWVAIDKKYDIGKDILPDLNSYEVFFNLSENSTTQYRYFKVEIDKILSGGGYMQMTEFALGDEYTFVLDRANLVNNAMNAVSFDKPMEKALKDAYQALLDKLAATTDIFAANAVKAELKDMQGAINASVNAYADYVTTVAGVAAHLTHSCMTDAQKAELRQYVEDNVAPNATFPNGSYPYIIANGPLNADEVKKEGKFIQAKLEEYATDLTEGAIVGVTYTALSSNKFDGGEGAQALVDGQYEPDNSTKWGFNGPGWIVFKCNEGPIAPTYYTLVVANDTNGNKGRQWKNWKIYGANFDADEAAERNAADWVLIDEKNNIGHDEFPTANFSKTSFNMTNGGKMFQYYRIEVESNFGGGNDYTQMGEIIFFNQANFIGERKEKADEYTSLLNSFEGTYYHPYRVSYEEALADLKTSSNGAEMSRYAEILNDLKNKIESSILKYADFADEAQYSVDAADFASYETGTTPAWYEAYYASEEIAPCALVRNGNVSYIMANGNLDNNQLDTEMTYLKNMVRAANTYETTGFVYLDGHVVGQWGDGHPSNLVDNVIGQLDENGGGNPPTKLGGNIDTSGDTYVIFKTMDQYNPYFYTLITGADTYQYQDRNPGSWTIYGANFEGDGDATVDSEGWIVVDEKVNIGKDRMLPQNLTASYFGFSTETTVPYQYYKIVIWGNFDGKSGAVQLQELQFGTVEQFENIKSEYTQNAQEFDTNVKAYKPYLEAYEDLADQIGDCVNMEVLYRINKGLELMRDTINESKTVYAAYNEKVEAGKAFVAELNNTDVDSYEPLLTYLTIAEEPCEEYPHGTAPYIWEELNVQDSVLVKEELPLLGKLMAAYTADTYKAGTDVSALVKNPGFEALDGWDGTKYYGQALSVDKTTGAAEWCVTDNGKFNISQTLTGMKPGLYLVNIGAAFRACNLNADGNRQRNEYGYNHMALAYANDAVTLVPTIREGMISVDDAEDGVNCNLSTGIADHKIYEDGDSENGALLGYVAWGVPGSAQAFKAGRYRNLLVAQVGEDGVLTFGVKNAGTPLGDDWTAVGDVRLQYLGTNPDATVAKEAIAAANANAAERATTLKDLYRADAEYVATYTDLQVTPLYGVETDALCAQAAAANGLAAVSLFSEAFERVPAEKKAYITLWQQATQVKDKWQPHYADPDNAAVVESFEEITENILDGAYNVATAEAAAEKLYAEYPDYFGITMTEVNDEELGVYMQYSIKNIAVEEPEPFAYEITFDGGRTPSAIFSGLYDSISIAREVMVFEYKSEKAINDAVLYYYAPSYKGKQDVLPELPAAADWNKVAITFHRARVFEGWCSAGNHGFELEFTSKENAAEGQKISLRNVIMMTEAEATAQGLEITAIEGVDADVVAPVLEGIYNLQGQRVNKAVKGIYIINGQKVLVK